MYAIVKKFSIDLFNYKKVAIGKRMESMQMQIISVYLMYVRSMCSLDKLTETEGPNGKESLEPNSK